MTETETSGQTQEPAAPKACRPRYLRAALIGAVLIGAGAVSGFAAGTVHGMPFWVMSAAAERGLNPERVARHIDRRVDRALGRVDATNEQRDKVAGIFKTAFTDLTALGIKPGEIHDKVFALMRADTVDPAAFEALRAEQVSMADAASKRVVQAMIEAAQVLTPEQRRELADRWESRRWGHHGSRHHRDR